MAKQEKEEQKILLYDLIVDGKHFGTFIDSEDKHRHLAGKKGIELRKFWGWPSMVTPPVKRPRTRRDKSTPLLEGVPLLPSSYRR